MAVVNMNQKPWDQQWPAISTDGIANSTKGSVIDNGDSLTSW